MATQACEDFPIQDLDQLLHMVIQVTPYLVAHKRVGEKWWEVVWVVQKAGFCKGRDADTLKNKVTSLLQWVENSSQLSSCTTLGHEAANDPVTFASPSGHLDKVVSMCHEVKDLSGVQREEKKKTQIVSQARSCTTAMMNTGHGKCKQMSRKNSVSPSDKENGPTDSSSFPDSTSDS
ncbi:hypothetical protein K439DRAFT_1614380 [Ramaria rubella]|nr:hypothetical protein K439DRAFT_1614380 [Ramaria rubella]